MKNGKLIRVDGYAAIVATLKVESFARYDFEKTARRRHRDLERDVYISGRVEGGNGRELTAKGFLTTKTENGFSEVTLYAVENDRILRIAQREGWRRLRIDRLISCVPTSRRFDRIREREEELEMLTMWGNATKTDWYQLHREAVVNGDWAAARRVGSVMNVLYGGIDLGSPENGLSSNVGAAAADQRGVFRVNFSKPAFNSKFMED